MNNDGVEKVYTTLDAYQAGFLVLRGHNPDFIEQGNKVVFSFTFTDSLLEDLSAYNNGAMVEASRFALSIKALKSRIHSMRRSNEKVIESKKSKAWE